MENAKEVFGDDDIKTYQIESKTVPGKFYDVKTKGSSILSCECKGWLGHKSCIHADEVIVDHLL